MIDAAPVLYYLDRNVPPDDTSGAYITATDVKDALTNLIAQVNLSIEEEVYALKQEVLSYIDNVVSEVQTALDAAVERVTTLENTTVTRDLMLEETITKGLVSTWFEIDSESGQFLVPGFRA